MAETFTRRISIYVDSGQAQVAYDKLLEHQTRLNKQLAEYTAKGKEIPEKLTKKLEEVNGALDRQSKKLSGELAPNLRDLQGTYSKLNGELSRMSKQDAGFDEKKKQTDAARVALMNYKSTLSSVKQSLVDMLKDAKGVAMGVLIGSGVQQIVQSIAAAVSGIMRFRNEFEASIKNLSAITGATGADLNFLENAAKDLSSTGSRSATEYVEAMKFIASAKPELLENKEALVEVTKSAALLARASGLDLPEASKRLTDALNQYGAPASEAAKYVDILAAAAKYGAAEVPGITDALLEFGPVAKQSNISFQESAAAIELLAEKGIKGSEAGTKLRNVFLTLSAVDALPKEALESLKKYGVNTSILSDKNKTLAERLTELAKVSGDANAMMRIFDKQNVVAATSMLTNIERLRDLVEKVDEVGVASAQAATNTGTLSSAWGKLSNALRTLTLGVGTDWLRGLVSSLSDAVTWFAKLTGVVKQQSQVIEEERFALNVLVTQITSTNEGTQRRQELIEKLNEAYPQMLENLDQENISNDQLKAKLQEVNTQYANRIVIQRKAEEIADASNDQADKIENRIRLENKLAETITLYAEKYNLSLKDGTIFEKAADLNKQLLGISQGLGIAVSPAARGAAALADYSKALSLAIHQENYAAKTFEDLVKQKDDLAKRLGIVDIPATASGGNDDGGGGNDDTSTQSSELLEQRKKKDEEIAALIVKLREELHIDLLSKNAAEVQALRYKFHNEREETQQHFADARAMHAGNSAKLLELKEQEAHALQLINEKEALELNNLIIKQGQEIEQITGKTSIAIADLGKEIKKIADAPNPFAAQRDAAIAFKEALREVSREINTVQQVFQQAANFMSTVFQVIAQEENQELRRDKRLNDEKKRNLKNQLDTKRISQSKYNEEVAKLDAEMDDKKRALVKKAFEREKGLRIAMTLINTAASVMTMLASAPWPVNLVMAALAGATGIAQVALIAKEQPPEFGGGTESLHGPKHSSPSRGMPVINPETGSVEALVEGGEAIIPADSAAANRPIIRRLIAARGRSISDQQHIGQRFLNVSRATENMMMAAGGFIPKVYDYGRAFVNRTEPTGGGNPASINGNNGMMEKMDELIGEMRSFKGKPVVFVKEDHDRFLNQLEFVKQRQV
jgi:TP901 family phage tail tape measure protein